MAQQSQVRNPFMLMMQPEVVLAALENSVHLEQFKRHVCRPLDRVTPAGQAAVVAPTEDEDDLADGYDA
jgi:hypothetical protein